MNSNLILGQVSTQQIIAMSDLLYNTIFWIKDADSRVVHANNMFVEHLGFKSIDQLLGKSDADFHPPHIAKQFWLADQRIMAGEHITEHIEVNFNKSTEAWFSTSKRPLFNDTGNIIGTYGVTRLLQKPIQSSPTEEHIRAPVEFIKKYFHQHISIEQLAEVAHLSVSALERRFKKYLDKTPKQYVREIRLVNARLMLTDTQLSISEIAYQSGFFSHSYFSHQFKLMFGELPMQYRQNINHTGDEKALFGLDIVIE
jgi:AraC-like DNA-binding protein